MITVAASGGERLDTVMLLHLFDAHLDTLYVVRFQVLRCAANISHLLTSETNNISVLHRKPMRVQIMNAGRSSLEEIRQTVLAPLPFHAT